MTSSLPEDLTPAALFAWQEQKEADLERVLTEYTERALSAIVDQAASFSLTAASARHLWEEAVDQTLRDLGMGVDGPLRESLLEAAVGDEAFDLALEMRSLTWQGTAEDEWKTRLLDALDLDHPSLLASGAEVESFWTDENWIEQTGTGHLPPYIRAIADALMRRGYGESRAIATAVNTVKRWARKGPAAKGGKGHVSAKTQAKAIKALLEWEAKRVEAHATAIAPDHRESLVAAGVTLADRFSTWRVRIKRQVRTGFTGVLGRLVVAELKLRGKKTKTWVSKHDARTRESHLMADGQTVPLDQVFHVGHSDLPYPGSRAGTIEETANCRCIVVPGKS